MNGFTRVRYHILRSDAAGIGFVVGYPLCSSCSFGVLFSSLIRSVSRKKPAFMEILFNRNGNEREWLSPKP